MREYAIKPRDVFEILRRHKKAISIAFTTAFSAVVLAFLVVPRTYESEAILHIAVSYFQNPLIGDLISQTHDPSELRSERERIIKSSLGVEFANRMGQKYKLFKSAQNDPLLATEIEFFLKDLEVTPVTSTQFKLRFRARTPETADGVIHGALESIREYMFDTRIRMLEQFSGVLQTEITSTLDDPMIRSAAAKPPSERTDAERARLGDQVQSVEKRLENLRNTYSDSHPIIQAARAELSELRAIESGTLSPGLTRRRIFRPSSESQSPSSESSDGKDKKGKKGETSTIKDDLSKQKHLVNISLEMERKDPSMSSYLSLIKEPTFPKKPVFPKKKMFLIFALICGIMAATVTAAVLEFWQTAPVEPQRVARQMKMEHLGTLYLEG